MELTMTQRELHDYRLAMMIVVRAKPLLLLDSNLELYTEIVKFNDIVQEAVNNEPRPYRGNRKVKLTIPEDIQTDNLNKAIRYGIPHALARQARPASPDIRFLESVVGIAYAGKIAPNPTNTYRVLTDEED